MKENDPPFFEHVVCEDVKKTEVEVFEAGEWEVFEAGEWVKHDWGFEKWEFVSKGKENTMNMKLLSLLSCRWEFSFAKLCVCQNGAREEGSVWNSSHLCQGPCQGLDRPSSGLQASWDEVEPR